MCGIVGYIGKNHNPKIGLEALKKLEYRGYDSAGMAVLNSKKKKIFVLKTVGKISNLEKEFSKKRVKGNPFILHTRWATHGAVTKTNAHPHSDCQKNIFLVHNGIIENYKILKEKLMKEGHRFSSETDTEVITHLIEKFFNGNLERAVQKALKFVRGTYGLAIISKDDPGKIVAARNSSPVLIGIGEGENIVASDKAAIAGFTKKIIYLNDGEIAVLTPSECRVIDFNQKIIKKTIEKMEWDIEEVQKGNFPHFMLKEIFEAPEVVENALRGRLVLKEGQVRLGGLEGISDKMKDIKRLIICACGSSYFSSLVGEYLLQEYAQIPTRVEYASEFRYKKQPFDKNTAYLFISQSGETADTLAALRKVKKRGNLTLGVVNIVGSSLARETDVGIYNHAGLEIGVASTKTFISQLVVFSLLSLFLARQRHLSKVAGQKIIRELKVVPQKIKTILKGASQVEKLAKKYKDFENFLFIGRKYNFPIALEGALKLKEISYVHAEGYGAGEMKHGPIALIDKNFPTVAVCPSDSVYEKTISNIEEIKARSGKIIAIASQGDRAIKELVNDVIYIPKTLEPLNPILTLVPLQLFAYYMGVLRGCDPDKPRNLAKSVTVE